MSTNTKDDRLRAILTIPLTTPQNLPNNSFRPFINPKIANTSIISLNNEFESELDLWHTGVLDPLTDSNIPADNFTKALLSEIPTQLHDLVLENRFFCRFINGGMFIGLSQIYVSAFEFWRNTNSSDPSFLIVHLECNNVPTSKQSLESLANLNSVYLSRFLDNFFEYIDDPSKEVSSLVLRISRKAMLILNFGHKNNEITAENGSLIIRSEDIDTLEPRLKSRFVFLSMVVGIQRYSVDFFKSEWPVLDDLRKKEALKLRSEINKFSNKWVWPRLSTDDSFNAAYKKWQDGFSISEYVKNFKDEIDDYLELKILQGSDRIESILLSVAVFGIIPTWLGLFEQLNQRVIAGSISISAFSLFMIWYRRKYR